ncbi:MAG: TetR/AcrR family transcriptional regulator [Clostridia bacterium]|nr:TetR/AcrR family transcriptional regulator [Clostridia bacterium]
MAKKGLSRDLIIDTALRLVEERGPMGLSMRELADALDVKAASLYNHISGMDDLMGQVGLRATEMRTRAQLEAIAGKTRAEALFALADTYHAFAMAHEHLDKVIMGLQRNLSPVLPQAGELTMKPILQVLEGYGLSDDAKIHWQRVLRATMHGFCVHEHMGGFSHSPLPVSDSYHMAIRCIAEGLEKAELKR